MTGTDPATTGEPTAPPPNPVPFVVALVIFVVLMVLAFVFLREDDTLDLVRPDAFRTIDEDSFEAVVDAQPACTEVVRAQVDLNDDDDVYVELVTRDASSGDDSCDDALDELRVVVDLPEPLDGRGLRAGLGRVQLPCTTDGSGTACSADG